MPRGNPTTHDDKFSSMPEGGYPAICQAEGCSKRCVGRGFCGMHYGRILRYGSVNLTRNDNRQKHPLFLVWSTRRQRRALADSWKDFWQFVKDVGNKPSPHHMMIQPDMKRPFGPDNFMWRPPVRDDVALSSADPKAYKLANRRKVLMAKYQLTVGEYEAILAAQGGGCAICGSAETYVNNRHGTTFSLSVDHDHETGVIRGILCGACNRGVGYFRDRPSLLDAASKYLRRCEPVTAMKDVA